jgi:hypothetical protein
LVEVALRKAARKPVTMIEESAALESCGLADACSAAAAAWASAVTTGTAGASWAKAVPLVASMAAMANGLAAATNREREEMLSIDVPLKPPWTGGHNQSGAFSPLSQH